MKHFTGYVASHEVTGKIVEIILISEDRSMFAYVIEFTDKESHSFRVRVPEEHLEPS